MTRVRQKYSRVFRALPKNIRRTVRSMYLTVFHPRECGETCYEYVLFVSLRGRSTEDNAGFVGAWHRGLCTMSNVDAIFREDRYLPYEVVSDPRELGPNFFAALGSDTELPNFLKIRSPDQFARKGEKLAKAFCFVRITSRDIRAAQNEANYTYALSKRPVSAGLCFNRSAQEVGESHATPQTRDRLLQTRLTDATEPKLTHPPVLSGAAVSNTCALHCHS